MEVLLLLEALAVGHAYAAALQVARAHLPIFSPAECEYAVVDVEYQLGEGGSVLLGPLAAGEVVARHEGGQAEPRRRTPRVQRLCDSDAIT